MTVAAETAYAERAWTGVESSFTPGFQAKDTTYVKAYSRDAAGVETLLTAGVHYAISLAADGAVTVTPIALPTAPTTLLFLRDTPATQAVDFANLASYDAATHTRLHDLAAMITGELKFWKSLALRGRKGETIAELPRAVDRALHYPKFDAAGNIVVGGLASDIESGAPAAAASAAAAAASAGNAASSATAAAGSATAAQNFLAGMSGTSTSSVLIATGSKSFTASTGKNWSAGQLLTISSNANSANLMHGAITSYNSTTGALVVNVLDIGGAGTFADWNITIAGTQGTQGPQGPAGSGSGDMIAANNLSDLANKQTALANLKAEVGTGRGDAIYTILATDKFVYTNAAFTASRTFTLPAANAVNAGHEIIVADLQGTVTATNTLVIARAGADTINGGTSIALTEAFGACRLISDGVSKWEARLSQAGAALAAAAIAQTANNLSDLASYLTALTNLHIEGGTGRGDAIYTILATDKFVYTNAAFTASRTFTLPAANAVNPGRAIIVADLQGTVTATNTLVISRAGADTINGGTSITLSNARAMCALFSDGTSKWHAIVLPQLGTAATQNTGTSGANVPLLNGANDWSGKHQFSAIQTLTDGATVNWDASIAQKAKVTFGGNRTMAAVTNAVEGAMYELWCIQDGTGTRVPTWTTTGAGSFDFGTAGAPTLTTTASKADLLTFEAISIGGTLKLRYCGIAKGFA